MGEERGVFERYELLKMKGEGANLVTSKVFVVFHIFMPIFSTRSSFMMLMSNAGSPEVFLSSMCYLQ